MPKKANSPQVTILGAGLAGTEATYQLIRRSIPVRLVEMRPHVTTGAHQTDLLAELVCSNSLGSNLPDRASGLLKEELRLFGCYILDVTYKYRVPAGNALAVDREAFAREITRYIKGHTLVDYVNEEAVELPTDGIVIVATGPLTSPALLKSLQKFLGSQNLFFFDAIAPLVKVSSIDMDKAFKADRYGEDGNGDYINCPLNQEEYHAFYEALIKAERIPLPEFETDARKKFFCACQPVEQIAASGVHSLRFGPMKPVGLTDPRTGKRPFAVVQLRQDNLLGNLVNMVGFQTNLKHDAQRQVFSMIPALAEAEFVRLGQMHRNTYIDAPHTLRPTLQSRKRENLFLAGQLTGVEGYAESVAMGMVAGMNALRLLQGKELFVWPPESMVGALINYITSDVHKDFHPMNANFGLFNDDSGVRGDDRRQKIISDARRAIRRFFGDLKA